MGQTLVELRAGGRVSWWCEEEPLVEGGPSELVWVVGEAWSGRGEGRLEPPPPWLPGRSEPGVGSSATGSRPEMEDGP